jgi:uncharacterized hydrophobic protein (TIGR00271 family)
MARQVKARSAPVEGAQVVHLRMLCPADLTDAALALVSDAPGACNVTLVRAAGVEPAGDLLMCDVAREAASIVFGDLRALGIAERGAITIERVDGHVSAGAEAAGRASPGSPGDAVVWEEVEAVTSESVALTASFLLFMVIATLIAAIGIFLDTPILIVGAMVVGPEFGPLAGLCVALVAGRGRLAARSLTALAVGFPLAIGAAYLASVIFRATGLTPDVFTEADHSLSGIIASPDAFTVIVAFCAGVAGMLSLTSAKSSVLIGVLISVTTIPAAANIGVAAAYSDWPGFRGSLLQLAINLGVIAVAGSLTLGAQRWIYIRRRARAA